MTTSQLIMHADVSTRIKHHALKVALVYFIIRCIPALTLSTINVLPPDTATWLFENHRSWVMLIYPVLPIALLSVPTDFQTVLAIFPILLIEVLLVFLFCVGFLRRRPALAGCTGMGSCSCC